MAKIKVHAGDGRLVPLPPEISTKPGATLHRLAGKGVAIEGCEPGEEIEVDDSDPFVVATLNSGDFVRVATPGLAERVAARFDTSDNMATKSDADLSTKKGS